MTVYGICRSTARGSTSGQNSAASRRPGPRPVVVGDDRDGIFSKVLVDRIADAFALRRLLLNLNNSIRFDFSATTRAPTSSAAPRAPVRTDLYRRIMCARLGDGARLAAEVRPKTEDDPELLRRLRRRLRLTDLASKAGISPKYFVAAIVPEFAEARGRSSRHGALLKQEAFNCGRRCA